MVKLLDGRLGGLVVQSLVDRRPSLPERIDFWLRLLLVVHLELEFAEGHVTDFIPLCLGAARPLLRLLVILRQMLEANIPVGLGSLGVMDDLQVFILFLLG